MWRRAVEVECCCDTLTVNSQAQATPQLRRLPQHGEAQSGARQMARRTRAPARAYTCSTFHMPDHHLPVHMCPIPVRVVCGTGRLFARSQLKPALLLRMAARARLDLRAPPMPGTAGIHPPSQPFTGRDTAARTRTADPVGLGSKRHRLPTPPFGRWDPVPGRSSVPGWRPLAAGSSCLR